jgi:hypothetical protein
VQLTLNRPSSTLPMLALILVALSLAGLFVATNGMKHHMTSTVLSCPDDKLGLRLLNPATGRELMLCEYSPGQFGEVVKDGDTIIHTLASPSRISFNELSAVIYRAALHGHTKILFIRPDLVGLVAEILAKE